MITSLGKIWIKQYLAGQVASIGNAVAVGVSGTAAAVTDESLGFELDRVPVTTIAYDFVLDQLIFKGTLSEELAGNIYEIGIYTSDDDEGSRLITTFDVDSELWTGTPTWDATNTRIGTESLRQAPGSGATVSNNIDDMFLDLSDFSGEDIFQLAYYNSNTFASSVQVRFHTDVNNYFTVSASAPAAGYRVSNVTKGSATLTGSPDWSKITSMAVRTTGSGGTATVDWDGISIRSTSPENTDNILVMRQVLAVPVKKELSTLQDLEFSLAVAI